MAGAPNYFGMFYQFSAAMNSSTTYIRSSTLDGAKTRIYGLKPGKSTVVTWPGDKFKGDSVRCIKDF